MKFHLQLQLHKTIEKDKLHYGSRAFRCQVASEKHTRTELGSYLDSARRVDHLNLHTVDLMMEVVVA
jgi:hypothetical protein